MLEPWAVRLRYQPQPYCQLREDFKRPPAPANLNQRNRFPPSTDTWERGIKQTAANAPPEGSGVASEAGGSRQQAAGSQRCRTRADLRAKLAWLPSILRWTHSPSSQPPLRPPRKIRSDDSCPPVRSSTGQRGGGSGAKTPSTLPKGSQGDEASSDHYLPIRVDCEHRSKLPGGGAGRGRPPHTAPHPPTDPASEAASGAQRGLMVGRGAGCGWLRTSPPALALPAACPAHCRVSSAPAQPGAGLPAPFRSAQPRGWQLRPAPPRGACAGRFMPSSGSTARKWGAGGSLRRGHSPGRGGAG